MQHNLQLDCHSQILEKEDRIQLSLLYVKILTPGINIHKLKILKCKNASSTFLMILKRDRSAQIIIFWFLCNYIYFQSFMLNPKFSFLLLLENICQCFIYVRMRPQDEDNITEFLQSIQYTVCTSEHLSLIVC